MLEVEKVDTLGFYIISIMTNGQIGAIVDTVENKANR